METLSISELDLFAGYHRQILLVASSWVQEEEEENEQVVGAAGEERQEEEQEAATQKEQEAAQGKKEEEDDESDSDDENEEEEDLPAIIARDLQLMDTEGNVVRVFKGMGGSRTVCTSVDDLICVTGGSSGGAHVLDPTTGEILMHCSKIEVRSHDKNPHIITPYFTTFGFGRAATPSRAYKVVRLSDTGACEVLTIGDGARWRPAQPPPRAVPSNRGSPVSIRGAMYFLVGKELPDDYLLRFDLESEQWEKHPIEGPRKLGSDEEERNKTSLMRVTELDGHLCMVQSLLQMTLNPRTNIWLLTDLSSGTWLKVYTIKMAPSTCLYTPLMLRDDGKLLLHCTTGCNFDEVETLVLQLYDPFTGTCSDVTKMPHNLVKKISICKWSLDDHV